MILIITSEDDQTTARVCAWLNFYQIPFYRLNETSELILRQLIISNKETIFEIEVNDFTNEKLMLDSRRIGAVWYRRGWLNLVPSNINTANFIQVGDYFKNEKSKLVDFFDYLFMRAHDSINCFKDTKINKLQVLWEASQLGFFIPETIVSVETTIINKYLENGKYITKGIDKSSIYDDNHSFFGMTEEVREPFHLPNRITFPSLIQEKIEKLFELRIFTIGATFFSSAIFSQNDEKTRIDFRNYNKEKPNRVVPYKLPIFMEEKLRLLMHKFSLNSGSFDIIVDKSGRYILLEVNPIGQFWQVSHPCSYYLEEKVALYLKSRLN